MPEGTVAKEATEVAWLFVATLGVVFLTVVAHTAYKDIQQFLKKTIQVIKPEKTSSRRRSS